MIDVILQAFASIVLDPVTLGLMFVGTLAGILAGAIPGFTIAMGVILTLPFTFGMTAVQGLATMLGVFVGGFSFKKPELFRLPLIAVSNPNAS